MQCLVLERSPIVCHCFYLSDPPRWRDSVWLSGDFKSSFSALFNEMSQRTPMALDLNQSHFNDVASLLVSIHQRSLDPDFCMELFSNWMIMASDNANECLLLAGMNSQTRGEKMKRYEGLEALRRVLAEFQRGFVSTDEAGPSDTDGASPSKRDQNTVKDEENNEESNEEKNDALKDNDAIKESIVDESLRNVHSPIIDEPSPTYRCLDISDDDNPGQRSSGGTRNISLIHESVSSAPITSAVKHVPSFLPLPTPVRQVPSFLPLPTPQFPMSSTLSVPSKPSSSTTPLPLSTASSTTSSSKIAPLLPPSLRTEWVLGSFVEISDAFQEFASMKTIDHILSKVGNVLIKGGIEGEAKLEYWVHAYWRIHVSPVHT